VARENVIRKFPVDKTKTAAENVELANKFFTENVEPSLPKPTPMNARPVNEAHLAERYAAGEGAFTGDLLALPLSTAPATPAKPATPEGARQ